MWNEVECVAPRNEEIDHCLGDVRTALDALLRDAEAMATLHRTAERYARVRRGSWEAGDLVWDAIGDLLLGGLPCDLARPLGPQLEHEVRRRANRWHRGKRPRRELRQPVFVGLEKAPTSALVLDAPQETDDIGQGPDPEELVSRIREQARHDEPALQLLALYSRGIVSRRDVLNSGMTAWAYRAAKERLVAYATTAAAAAWAATPATAISDTLTLSIMRVIGLGSRTAHVRRAVSRVLHRTGNPGAMQRQVHSIPRHQ